MGPSFREEAFERLIAPHDRHAKGGAGFTTGDVRLCELQVDQAWDLVELLDGCSAHVARDHGLYSQVAEVKFSFFRPHRITLVLKAPCELGKKITFLPYTYLVFPWQEHPVVQFLRVRCG